jgi:hypothetical protein
VFIFGVKSKPALIKIKKGTEISAEHFILLDKPTDKAEINASF